MRVLAYGGPGAFGGTGPAKRVLGTFGLPAAWGSAMAAVARKCNPDSQCAKHAIPFQIAFRLRSIVLDLGC